MPCSKVLANIPAYAKFLKEIVSNTKKLEDFVEMSLIEEYSAVLKNHLPIKMKDLGSFTVPCQFEHILVDKCLCDLGSSVNLMALPFFKKLNFANLGPTQAILQLTDRSMHYPIGIIEDLLVKFDKFYFSADFLVHDMEEDISMQIILDRGFLATGWAKIDLLEGKLTLRVGKEKEEFNVFEPLKYPSYEESCSYITISNDLYGEKYVLQQDVEVTPLQNHRAYFSSTVQKHNGDVKNYAKSQAHAKEIVKSSKPFHPP
ncbi:uncharacterized protein LOC113774020 [Coffea eugenioides]|uniref:uncharacterized protein LOC113774020 n=1 Tax=Coffea eugenioides TaxID=49369 RepID=UPI000F60FB0C|nr:uncharacterized protein LOC113774020 [Coffea eugenioides]